MSGIVNALASRSNKSPPLSLRQKVVAYTYGPKYGMYNDDAIPTATEGQVRICAAFCAHPLPLQNPMHSLEIRTKKFLENELLFLISTSIEAIDKLVENRDDETGRQASIQDELTLRVCEETQKCFYAGAFEGSDDGRNVIKRICGDSLSSSQDYYFVTGPKAPPVRRRRSLPFNVTTKFEWECLHRRKVNMFKVHLGELESAIEATVSRKTRLLLAEEGGGWRTCRKRLEAAIWETLFCAFKLGKHTYFVNGQFLQKSDLGLDFDKWVYYFVQDESDERINIRNTNFPKKRKATSVTFVANERQDTIKCQKL